MLIKDKSFYRTFFSLWGALVVQNIIVHSVNLADNIMIGAYGENALSGVAAVNQIQFVLQQVLGGIGEGVVVLSSQYWGQRRTEPIRKFSSIGLRLAVSFALIMFLLVSVFPVGALQLFTTESAVISEGIRYLNIIRFTYPVCAVTTVLLATLRSVETIRVALYVSVSTLFVNCGLNFVLIQGRFGFPALGSAGAAIGTLTARLVELVIIVCYLLLKDKKLQLRPRDCLVFDRTLFGDYVKTSLPIVFTAALWGLNNAIHTMILGHMTASAIAANSAASTLYLVLKVAAVGGASASAILIGKAVGAGDMKKIKDMTHTLQLIYLGIGVFIAAGLLLLRGPILSLYDLSPETREMAYTFLGILSVTGFGMAYEMQVNCGIVRGGGDSRFVMVMDLISIWGIVLPVSALAAFVFHWPPALVVICLNADQVFKCLPAGIRANNYKWVKKLTR
ncbi:MAG: MATE family efflux transporter [Oscillospiraceae bacterium]|nr:MATE family efflux transporter [Oscillospiraceae bacterium]